MRLVVAECQVDYVGRLSAHLPMARRLLLIKADGSVSVHADDRAYKPLNWMSPPCTLAEVDDDEHTVWEVTSASLGAQDALSGGGRYRVNAGGREIDGVGFGVGHRAGHRVSHSLR